MAKGPSFHVVNRGNKQINNDKVRDKENDLQDMESALKELLVVDCFCYLPCLDDEVSAA